MFFEEQLIFKKKPFCLIIIVRECTTYKLAPILFSLRCEMLRTQLLMSSSLDHLSFLCSIGLGAYNNAIKFRPSTPSLTNHKTVYQAIVNSFVKFRRLKLTYHQHYGSTGCGVFKWGIQN